MWLQPVGNGVYFALPNPCVSFRRHLLRPRDALMISPNYLAPGYLNPSSFKGQGFSQVALSAALTTKFVAMLFSSLRASLVALVASAVAVSASPGLTVKISTSSTNVDGLQNLKATTTSSTPVTKPSNSSTIPVESWTPSLRTRSPSTTLLALVRRSSVQR